MHFVHLWHWRCADVARASILPGCAVAINSCAEPWTNLYRPWLPIMCWWVYIFAVSAALCLPYNWCWPWTRILPNNLTGRPTTSRLLRWEFPTVFKFPSSPSSVQPQQDGVSFTTHILPARQFLVSSWTSYCMMVQILLDQCRLQNSLKLLGDYNVVYLFIQSSITCRINTAYLSFLMSQ